MVIDRASCMVRNGGADEQASMDHESFTATWIIPRFLGQRVHTLSIKVFFLISFSLHGFTLMHADETGLTCY